MFQKVNILIIEDSRASLNLIVAELKRNGLHVVYKQASSAEELRRALKEKEWDIILSDHVMPGFNSIEALDILNEMKLDTPFIIVSGEIDEELAIRAMRSGCKDFIMKHALHRLGPAVLRELEEAGRRREDLRIQKALFDNLMKAKAEAESANEAKSRFIATMSHEVRTPINGIIGMLELTMTEPLSQYQRDNLNLAKKSAESLTAILGDILDFSKIEAGKLELNESLFSLKDMLQQIYRLYLYKAGNKGVRLQLSIDPDVPDFLHGDPVKLQQILNNLVTNAVKFTHEGTILISVSVTETSAGTATIQFSVSDTGIGIEEEDICKLFTGFTQLNGSYTREYGGTGLGLAISKRLVELMRGTISVKSRKGVGSTFSFTAGFRYDSSECLEKAAADPVPTEEEKNSDSEIEKALDMLDSLVTGKASEEAQALQDYINNSALLSSSDELVNLSMKIKINTRRNNASSVIETADKMKQIMTAIKSRKAVAI